MTKKSLSLLRISLHLIQTAQRLRTTSQNLRDESRAHKAAIRRLLAALPYSQPSPAPVDGFRREFTADRQVHSRCYACGWEIIGNVSDGLEHAERGHHALHHNDYQTRTWW